MNEKLTFLKILGYQRIKVGYQGEAMEAYEDGVAYVHKQGEKNVPSSNDDNKDGNCCKSQNASINPALSMQDEW